MNSNTAPLARREEIVVQNADGEVLIYDLRENKAFCLNQTSAIVWESCDGTRDIDAIAREAGKKANQNITNDLVILALADLKKEGLVSYAETSGFNRRDAIRRIGVASLVALPVISSLVAPKAAHAQSVLPAICRVCIKKSDGIGACTQCQSALGTCFDNAGCGGGQLVGSWTCVQCHNGTASAANSLPFNGTVSWVAN